MGPTCQSSRAAPTPWLKAAVGTARRASRQHLASPAPRPIAASRRSPPTVASPAPPAFRPRRTVPDCRLARAARLMTASLTVPPSRPLHRPRRCPDRSLTRRRRAAVRRPRAGEPPFLAASHAPATCPRRLAEQRRRALRRRAPRRPRPSRAAPRVAVGRARGLRQHRARGPCPTWPRAAPRTVHLGRAVSAQ